MRNVSKDTLTETFLGYCAADTDPRLRYVLERLAHHLHTFVQEVGLTHAEWEKGIELLVKAGEISDANRNEFILFSDVLGVSSLVDMVNTPADATSSSVLGPFHILGAPALPVGGNLKQDNEGEIVVFTGQVQDTAGQPVPGAALEIWQTAGNGLYSNQDAAQPDYNLRARMTVGDDGRYAFTTVRPAPYTVPDDGPVGELLRATGRHPWRPSHMHFIVEADGFRTLVTELFPGDDPYLDEDAVFGVREELVREYVRHDDVADLPPGLEDADKIAPPFQMVDFDITLARAD